MELRPVLLTGGHHINEIHIRPHTQTMAVSIQTTVSHFGSGSLLGPISCRFGIWCPSPRLTVSYFAAS